MNRAERIKALRGQIIQPRILTTERQQYLDELLDLLSVNDTEVEAPTPRVVMGFVAPVNGDWRGESVNIRDDGSWWVYVNGRWEMNVPPIGTPQKTACAFEHGTHGVPGNENNLNGIVVCDNCTVRVRRATSTSLSIQALS